MKEVSSSAIERSTPPRFRTLLSRRWVRVTGVLCAFLLVCSVVISRSFAWRISEDVFFSLTLAGCLTIFFAVRPIRELGEVAALGLVFSGLQWIVLGVEPRPVQFFALLGLSSVMVLLARKILAEGKNQLLWDAIVPPLLLLLLGYAGSGPLALTNRLHPATMDLFLYRMDQSFGVQLSFKVARAVLSSTILTRGAMGIYHMLPLMMMLAYARQLVRDRNLAMTAFLAFVIVGPVGLLLYNWIPACGPEYLFGSDFPLRQLTAQQLRQLPLHLIAVPGMRNAFPSLHLAWALLIWWYSEGLSRGMKNLFIAFLAGTGVVTLGLGEHYLVDLVAGVPFALAIYSVCALRTPISDSRRVLGIGIGFALTIGWAALVQYGMRFVEVSPLIPWFLTAITVVVSLWLQKRVQQADSAKLSVARP